MTNFLREDGKYMDEASQYVPEAEVTDVSKVISKGIIKERWKLDYQVTGKRPLK